MAAGFQLIGDAGNTQIDENFINYSLLIKNTIYISGSSAEISFTAISPLLFFSNFTSNISITLKSRNGNSFIYKIQFHYNVNYNSTLTYYVFDLVPNTPSAVGITIFNANGVVTFSSDYRPLRIAKVYKLPNYTGQYGAIASPNPSFSLPYTGNFAVCLTQERVRRNVLVNQGNSATEFLSDGVGLSSTAVSVQEIRNMLLPIAQPGVQQAFGGTILLADITNF